ncbi:bifunctional demethylmenaquinone methyltransferase/2-methoxy-6-polyprenyl-1,4-benzoquinol methylase UbiE [Paludibacter sp.]
MMVDKYLNDNVKPYNQHEDKTSQLINLFNKISSNYDRFNDIISMGLARIWRKRAITLLKNHQPKRILDIATGTADLLLTADSILKPDSIIGIDISEQMMNIGRQKLVGRKINAKISFQLQNASSLSFENASFDAVTIGFGIRNIEKLSVAIQEINRVLDSSGLFMILEVNQPQKGFRLLLYKIFIFINSLTIRKVLDKADFNYLINSMREFPNGKKLIDIVENEGFKLIKHKRYNFDVCSAYLFSKED